MTDLISTRHGRILVLRLNRPERGNRISMSLATTISHAIREADSDQGTDAVILTGGESVFCLGGDSRFGGLEHDALSTFADRFADLITTIRSAGLPVIAAAEGDAYAGGFALLANCDLGILAEDTTLALPEAVHGSFPMLATAALRSFLPQKVFFGLVYLGKKISAEEAVSYGLANEIVPKGAALSRAIELARSLSDLNPAAIRIGRKAYFSMQGLSETEALDHAKLVVPRLVSATTSVSAGGDAAVTGTTESAP